MPFAHGKQVRVLAGHLDSPANANAPVAVAGIPGSGDNFAYDVSSYLKEVSIANPVDVADTSAFGSQAKTSVIGQYTSTIQCRGMFEDTAVTGLDAIVQPMMGVECAQALGIHPTGYTDMSKPSAQVRRAYAGLGYVTSYDVSGSVGDMVSAGLNLQGTGNVRSGFSIGNPTAAIANTVGTSYAWGGATANDGVDWGAAWNTSTKPALIFLFVVNNTASAGGITVRYHESATQGSGYAANAAIPAFSSVAFGAHSCQVIEVPAGTAMARYGTFQYVIATGGTGSIFLTAIIARQG